MKYMIFKSYILFISLCPNIDWDFRFAQIFKSVPYAGKPSIDFNLTYCTRVNIIFVVLRLPGI